MLNFRLGRSKSQKSLRTQRSKTPKTPRTPKSPKSTNSSSTQCIKYRRKESFSGIMIEMDIFNIDHKWRQTVKNMDKYLRKYGSKLSINCAIFAAGIQSEIHIYNKYIKPIYILHGHREKVLPICRSRELLISGSFDQSIKVWDLSKNILRGTFTDTHKNTIQCLCTLSHNLVASGSLNHKIEIFNIENMTRLLTPYDDLHNNLSVASLLYDPYAQIIYSGCYDSTIKLWDGNGNGEKENNEEFGWKLKGEIKEEFTVQLIAKLDGGLVTSASSHARNFNTFISIWDVGDAKQNNDNDREKYISPEIAPKCLCYAFKTGDRICTLVPLYNGTIATGSSEGCLEIWKTEQMSEIARYKLYQEWLTGIIEINPNYLITSSDSGVFRSVDLASSRHQVLHEYDETRRGWVRSFIRVI